VALTQYTKSWLLMFSLIYNNQVLVIERIEIL
ncbi:MAG: hypothetical protein ACI9BN_000718, partial [Francisella sp.]